MATTTKTQVTDDVTALSDSSPPSTENSPTAVLQVVPKRTWKSYFWDTFDKSPEERRFLFKLDAALMTLASLGYFIKYLDQVRCIVPECAPAY
jgi:MFS transporter, ACS family, pantothenate transporter